jgi:DNA-binding CsgD family transcriptional regulator
VIETTLHPPVRERWKLPADSVVREKASQIVAMKIQGLSTAEIAVELGLTPHSVRQYLYLAGKNGWLLTSDPNDQLEYSLAHKIVRNVSASLDGAVLNTQQHETTIAAARGIGLFKQHEVIKGDVGTSLTALSIKIESSGPAQATREDTIAGTPAYAIEGEVVE